MQRTPSRTALRTVTLALGLALVVLSPLPPAAAGEPDWVGGPAQGWERAMEGDSGVVHFGSSPPGAAVLIRDAVLCRATPCWRRPPPLTEWVEKGDGEYEEVPSRSGSYPITMRLARYQDITRKIRLVGSEQITWEFSEDYAFVSVVTDPPGLNITANRQVIGTSPVKRVQVKPGELRLTIHGSCHEKAERVIHLDPGEHESVDIELKVRTVPLKVETRDREGGLVTAQVLVDGRVLDERAPGTLKVPLCARQITVKKDGHRDEHQSLTLSEKNNTAAFIMTRTAEGHRRAQRSRNRDRTRSEPSDSESSSSTSFDPGLIGRLALGIGGTVSDGADVPADIWFPIGIELGMVIGDTLRVGGTLTIFMIPNGDAPSLEKPEGAPEDEAAPTADGATYFRFGLGTLLGVQSDDGIVALDLLAGTMPESERCTAWEMPEGTCTVHRSIPGELFLSGRFTLAPAIGNKQGLPWTYALELGTYGSSGRVLTFSVGLGN